MRGNFALSELSHLTWRIWSRWQLQVTFLHTESDWNRYSE